MDLIDRQTVIDALRKAYWDNNIQSAKDDPCIVDAMIDWAIRQIKALPSAQPETQWIPRSERLPEENGEYLVTRESSSYRYIDIVRKSNCNSHLPMASDIKAWMPLPEPWRGEVNDKNGSDQVN